MVAVAPRLGLIAGEGELASCVARNASALGMEVVAISLAATLDPGVERSAARVYRVDLRDALSIMSILKQEGVTEAVMIGKVWRADGFGRRVGETVELVARDRRDRTDVEVLLAFAEKLEGAGITLISQLRYLGDAVPGGGVLGRLAPSSSQWEDVRFGLEIAMRVGEARIGQAVAVKGRAVVAVEAAEGTDAMVRRAGRLAPGCAVVKVAWPDQDERFDVPAVGPGTIEAMQEAKAKVLAVEAGRTIIVRKRDTIGLADEAGIAMVGVSRARGGDA